jgi:hypothetical protein
VLSGDRVLDVKVAVTQYAAVSLRTGSGFPAGAHHVSGILGTDIIRTFKLLGGSPRPRSTAPASACPREWEPTCDARFITEPGGG